MALLLEILQPVENWTGGLGTLLPSTRHLHATDPRDKVYAFLSFSRSVDERETPRNNAGTQWSDDMVRLMCEGKAIIVPDYAIDVELVHSVTAKRIMHECRNLGMLCHVQRKPMSSSLPPWAPDWREPATIRILGEMRPKQGPFFISPQFPSSHLVLDLGTNLRSLKVYGICFDTIGEVRSDLRLADVYPPGVPGWVFPQGRGMSTFFKDVVDFMIKGQSPARGQDNSPTPGSLHQDFVEWATDWFGPKWTSHWLMRRYLDLQTAGLSLNLGDFDPGHPVWHYFMNETAPDIFRGEMKAQCLGAGPNGTDSKITFEYLVLAEKIKFGRAMFRTAKLGTLGLCPE
ncbi:uncharacterized protein PG986_012826 [Apiospora aurea]|uniref:Uncharacterized protein n=1 Tax=Apiospora aurea TaxID=335848 RepID=A0ABR1Q133_9PEZI